jgi:head-tail adaptor
VFARVTADRPSEGEQAGQVSATTSYKVSLRFRSDIDGSKRFLMGGGSNEIAEDLDSSETVVTVDDAAFVGSAQDRRVRALLVGNELMEITSVDGNDITVTRAAFGTTAAEHSNGDKATLYRQLNIEGEPYDPNGNRREMLCQCTEVV